MVPADCLLLDGTCIAEEAVLTGESTPTWKVPACELDPKEQLNIKLVGGMAGIVVPVAVASKHNVQACMQHATCTSSGKRSLKTLLENLVMD